MPVSDMPRAVACYSAIFGLPPGAPSHDGTIYDVPMQGATRLILDPSRPVGPSSQPLCFFWTADIHAARTYLQHHDVPLLSDITDVGSVAFLLFQDPDGNRLMVCQRRQLRAPAER